MKTKKIIIFIIILFAGLIWANTSKAAIQSQCIVISEPKNGAVYKIGEKAIVKYAIFDVYMNLFNNEIYTNPVINVYYKGNEGLKKIDSRDLGIIYEKITDHKRGDVKYGEYEINLAGDGGIIIFDILCKPRNAKTLAIDDRISVSAYAAKTIQFYVYSDKPASAVFENSYVTKKVGDAPFTNRLRTDSDGSIEYCSNNTKVATVDSKTGEVTIKGEGTAKILALVKRSFIYQETAAEYTVKVTDANKPSKNDTVNNANNQNNQNNGNQDEPKKDENNTPAPSKENPTLKFASSSVSKTTESSAFKNKLTTNSDGKITYKSSNTNVAKVNSSTGTVTIKGVGTAVITAISAETEKYNRGSASYKVTVTAPTTSSVSTSTTKPTTSTSTPTTKPTTPTSNSTTVSKATPTLKFASSSITKETADSSFTNKLTYTTDGSLSYTSSNSSVVSINPRTGLVSIKGEGTATITVTSSETSSYKAGSASYKVTVSKPKTNTNTTVKSEPKFNFDKRIVTIGLLNVTTGKRNSTVSNKLNTNTDGKLTYKSSNTSIAEVNSSTGVVTIKKSGTVTISVSSAETKNYKAGSDSYKLIVTDTEQ